MTLLSKDEHWSASARCASEEASPDALFVEGPAQRMVRAICQECPVHLECLADALDNRVEFGVWGGMTERERRLLLRRYPEVRSWSNEFTHGFSTQPDERIELSGRLRDFLSVFESAGSGSHRESVGA